MSTASTSSATFHPFEKKFPFVTVSDQVGWVESKLKYFTIYLDNAESRVNAQLLPIAFDANPRAPSPSHAQTSSAESNPPETNPGTRADMSAASQKVDTQAPKSKSIQYYYIGLRRAAAPGTSGHTPELSVDLTEAWHGFAQSVSDFQKKNSNMDILIRSITREHIPYYVHQDPVSKPTGKTE